MRKTRIAKSRAKFRRVLKNIILWTVVIAAIAAGTLALCKLVEKMLLEMVVFVVAVVLIVAFFKANERQEVKEYGTSNK